MKPIINETTFGSITIDKQVYEHDVIIRLEGHVRKRKKKLSKAIYGSSHTLSLDEAKYVYEKTAKQIIIGTGQYGRLNLSDEAADYFQRKKCKANLLSTAEAIDTWNKAEPQKIIGLFHVTC